MEDFTKINPQHIEACARSLIHTPYKHQGRTAKKELDCIGVIILTAKLARVIDDDFDFLNYDRNPDGNLKKMLDMYCQPLNKIQLGTIGLFKMDAVEHHCGIITNYAGDPGLLHAWDSVGVHRVTEHRLDKFWEDRMVAIYGFPSVDYAS